MTLARTLQAAALQWQAEGRAAVVVEVLDPRGSVPREAGTRMLVAADAVLGTIGGGHLELQAISRARQRLQSGQPPHRPFEQVLDQSLSLGPSLGQCCGGALTLRYTPLAQDRPAGWALPAPRFTLQLFGAGHVGRAIVALLDGIDCRVHWVDEREAEFPAAASAPHVERRCVEPGDGAVAEVATASPGAFFLVLTHRHDLDLALTEAVLRRGDFGFLGLIGSRSKRQRFEHRLAARGLPAAALARITCPIGLPGLAGKSPAVIAVSAVAQLLLQPGGANSGLNRLQSRRSSDAASA